MSSDPARPTLHCDHHFVTETSEEKNSRHDNYCTVTPKKRIIIKQLFVNHGELSNNLCTNEHQFNYMYLYIKQVDNNNYNCPNKPQMW